MKKEIFAKIIELPTHQVLVIKEYNADDDTYEVIPMISFKGVNARLKFGFKDKKKYDKCFKDFDEKEAKKVLSALSDMLK